MGTDQQTSTQPYILPGHSLVPEPRLKFHPQREEDVDDHPLRGLDRFGPYSRPVLGAVNDPIRLALIAPQDGIAQIKGLLKEIEGCHQPRERRAYLVGFRGFSATFGARIVLAEDAQVVLPPSLDEGISKSLHPYRMVAEQLVRAVNVLQTQRSQFDVLLIYLPERWKECFISNAADAFDLHDFVKSHTASAGIPTQILREDRVLTYVCRCSVMWRLGIALYSKAGGVPWKLAQMEPGTMYVGVGYAVKYDESGEPTFLTTTSQVFDHDGTGLEFIAYETRDMIVERDNPT